MEKILLSPELFEILAGKFAIGENFIKAALDLTEVPKLDVVSTAKTIREAEGEQIEAEGCCNHEERAAFRRWIELATDEAEIMRVFERIGDCEDAEPEKMLAIREMAEMLKNK